MILRPRAVDPVDDAGNGIGVDVVDDDLAPLARISLGDRLTDSLARAGDDNDLVFE